jgi:hypothetical protein
MSSTAATLTAVQAASQEAGLACGRGWWGYAHHHV